jgi:primosomal protein N' (replication factor Y)
VCPACGKKLVTLRPGTQTLEEELERAFASMGIRNGSTMLRMDADTMRTARHYFEALAKFERGEARILIGTQMIAKGLDFPGVSLVGIIDADGALSLPDFRCTERTFQLVSQVAGRAGRGDSPGVVIVQTQQPHHPSIVLASRHDFRTFATGELSVRARAQLPPYSRMARVVCRDMQLEKAMSRAQELEKELIAQAPTSVSVWPAAVCTLSRIAGYHRVAVDIYAPGAGVLREVLNALRGRGLLKSDARTAVDVDPVALL